jgi:histidinol-phosphate aminotransferase
MSKWAALAGIRLGYAVMAPDVAREMNKVKSPYNISIAAQVAGEASLLDREYLMTNVQKIVEERERLYRRLASLPYGTVYPSQTNFLYWKLDEGSAGAWKEALTCRGILVRALHVPSAALRFSVGTPQESEALLQGLDEVHAAGPDSVKVG